MQTTQQTSEDKETVTLHKTVIDTEHTQSGKYSSYTQKPNAHKTFLSYKGSARKKSIIYTASNFQTCTQSRHKKRTEPTFLTTQNLSQLERISKEQVDYHKG